MRRRAAKGLSSGKAGETTGKDFLVTLALPTFTTMIPMGVWHGAGFQFFIFGLLNAFYICLNHAWRLFGPKISKAPPSGFQSWCDGAWKWGLTYLSISIALIFFRAKTTADAFQLIGSLFDGGARHS